MNIINHIKLAERLGANQVTEKEKFFYLIVAAVFLSIIMSQWMSNILYTEYNQYAKISDILTICFSAIAIGILFYFNQKGDGKNFIERYICLSVPANVQFIILGVVIALFIELTPLREPLTLQSGAFTLGDLIYESAAILYIMLIQLHGIFIATDKPY